MGLSDKDKRIIESVENNEFVDDIDINNMKFTYSKDFYVMMAKLLKNGKSPVEAYNALGFDTSIVGENRAFKAAQKAKKLASKPNYGIDPLDYDGSIERDKMGTMTKEEEAAYLKARVLYLEKVVEFQKNSIDIGTERYIFQAQELVVDKLQIAESLIKSCRGLSKSQCLKVTGVSKSSYYNYLKNKDKAIAKRLAIKQENESIMEKFKEIISSLGHVPGKRTFKAHMWRRYGINLSIKKCKKIMYLMHLVPTLPKKDAYKGQATHFHECACAFNYVNQDFKIGPRRVILTDITYLYYGLNRNRCYLCIFKDAFTNEILGHSVSLRMNVSLIKEAYDLMMNNHKDEIKANKVSVYIHSDQGSQYLSTDFKTLLNDDGFIQSNSFRGNSQDNAPCESTFARLKTEIIDIIARCPNVTLVKEIIDGYIDTFNNQRYQLPLAGLSPHEFYLYSITGIYPLDNYFGIKASKLLSIEDLVKAKLDEQKRLSDKRKELSNKRRLESSKLKDPEKILLRDQSILNKEICKWQGILAQANNQITFLRDLYDKNCKAIIYYGDLALEEKEQFKDPLKWRDTPEMSYVLDMADLF